MILIFGGTTEGRVAVQVLDESGREYYYSTKGDAQQIELVHGKRLTGAMTEERMREFLTAQNIKLVVDAAHPFAAELHRTIGRATEALGIPVVRYERMYPPLDPRIIPCSSYDDMIDKLLAQPAHRLLALTGTNTIGPMKRFWSQRESFFRILDREDSREKAIKAGFPMDHIRYFAEGEDEDLFREVMPDAVTTKESGESGFFLEKIAPALEAGVPVYMVERPKLPEHYQPVNGPVGLRKAVERIVPEFFPLKTGFTTGTTATAAMTAALQFALGLNVGEDVEVRLPSGESIRFPIDAIEVLPGGRHVAHCHKVSGDDPDVTQGTRISAEIRLRPGENGVRFLRGEGVGIVTLPGIGIEIGEPAINATPRKMMTEVAQRLYPQGGVDVVISVPEGRELALKTFNPRLGIEGGISIIGTSGVVKPFSSDAFIASIARQVEVALALGTDTIVINSGAKSERYLKSVFPQLPSQAYVQYGNFIGETLHKLAEHSVPNIHMGVMLGKAVKLAEGNMDTHSKKVVMNKSYLHEVASVCGCSVATHELIDRLTLARELWLELSFEDLDLMMPYIAKACHKVCQGLVPNSKLSLLLIDDEGSIRYTFPTEFITQLIK